MSDHPVSLTASGPPRTVLPADEPLVRHLVQQARSAAGAEAQQLAADAVRQAPRSMSAWCVLGDVSPDPVARYAAYRVGYHRGLDALRANGWRGSGYVRWADESNRGFLGCLMGLRRMANEIGEADEVERIGVFLAQLDPNHQWD